MRKGKSAFVVLMFQGAEMVGRGTEKDQNGEGPKIRRSEYLFKAQVETMKKSRGGEMTTSGGS